MKKVMALILAMALVFTLVACASSNGTPDEDSSSSAAVSDKVLKVGMMPSSVGTPAQYAYDNGYFKDAGINVELVIFSDGAAINEAMAAGEIDVACSGAATVFALANGENVLLGDVEMSGGMGIWVQPDSGILSVQGAVSAHPDMYGDADTIRGITIVTTLGTASQYNVDRYLEQMGLAESDVNMVSMDWASAVQAFQTREAEAIATFAPYSNQCEEAGGVKICSFEDATETALYDMIFTSKSVLANRRADLVAFLTAFYRAQELLASDKDTRSSFSLEWFASEGRAYTEETMAQEIADRPYLTKNEMDSDDYILGDAMYDYAWFQVSASKIEQDQMENMKTCYDASLLSEALGITVAQPAF